MKNKLKIILAPPGAGKTTFVDASDGLGTPVVDADKWPWLMNVYHAMVVQFGPHWFLRPEACHRKDELVCTVIDELTIDENAIYVTAEPELYRAAEYAAFVLPPLSKHEVNMTRRLNSFPPTTEPVYVGRDLLDIREWYLSFVTGKGSGCKTYAPHNLLIYTDFPDAYWELKNNDANTRRVDQQTGSIHE